MYQYDLITYVNNDLQLTVLFYVRFSQKNTEMVTNTELATFLMLLMVAMKLVITQDTNSYNHQGKDLVGAIAQLQAYNSMLSARVAASENTNSQLQQRINELESNCFDVLYIDIRHN